MAAAVQAAVTASRQAYLTLKASLERKSVANMPDQNGRLDGRAYREPSTPQQLADWFNKRNRELHIAQNPERPDRGGLRDFTAADFA